MTGRSGCPGVEPGGWAFEYENDLYPDVDDAAVVALALAELGAGRPAVERACRWLAGMQCANGGWGAFDVDNDAYWLYDIPFCDFGAVIDPPSVDVTAHVVELLAREPGYEEAGAAGRRVPARASRSPTDRGGAAGASTTSTGPGRRCPRSRRPGSRARSPGRAPRGRLARERAERGRRLRRGLPLLRPRRGGARLEGPGRRRPPSQTAWALMGLVAGRCGAIRERRPRGRRWLCERQRRRRGLGRGALHRHRLSARLPDSLPPLPDRLAADRPRPLPGSGSLADGSAVRVYVTGASGFVGAHVARELAGAGRRRPVERVDLLDAGRPAAAPSGDARPCSTSLRSTATTPTRP